MDNYKKKTINFLEIKSSDFCKQNNIKLEIIIDSIDEFNATVEKIGSREYKIKIYSGCLHIDHCIEKMTRRYNEDDLQTFFRFKDLSVFERYENTYREELNNLFSMIILLHIFWHEVGHICAGHVDVLHEYIEFDSSAIGGYFKQEQEMVADWLSTKSVFKQIYFDTIHGKVKDSNELIIALKQLVVLYWISLTIEFQIADLKSTSDVSDFSELKHPYPAVRLLYSIEAMGEAIMDIFNNYGLDDNDAEKAMELIVNDIYIIIDSFLQITDCPIDIKKGESRVIECYKILRELPYSDEYETNDFLHLLQLDDSYLEQINYFLGENIFKI